MRTLKLILGELAGLFVDDGSLAVAILVLVAAVAAIGLSAPAWLAGAILFIGLILILAENLLRTARR